MSARITYDGTRRTIRLCRAEYLAALLLDGARWPEPAYLQEN